MTYEEAVAWMRMMHEARTQFSPDGTTAFSDALAVLEREHEEAERYIRWKPIDTAPNDRRILLARIVGHPDHPTALWWATIGEWSEKYQRWWDRIEPSGLAGPTHWMDISAHGVARKGVSDE